MEVGTLDIKGSINTQEVDRGFERMRGGFRQLEVDTKTSFSSFKALGGAAANLAASFVTISTIGVGAMVALASSAPAVAPAIAKMGIEIQKISFSLGRTLAPLFESVANTLLPAVGTAIDALGPKSTSWVDIMVKGVEELAFAISILSGQKPEIKLTEPEKVLDEGGKTIGYRGAQESIPESITSTLWQANQAGGFTLPLGAMPGPVGILALAATVFNFFRNKNTVRATMEGNLDFGEV